MLHLSRKYDGPATRWATSNNALAINVNDDDDGGGGGDDRWPTLCYSQLSRLRTTDAERLRTTNVVAVKSTTLTNVEQQPTFTIRLCGRHSGCQSQLLLQFKWSMWLGLVIYDSHKYPSFACYSSVAKQTKSMLSRIQVYKSSTKYYWYFELLLHFFVFNFPQLCIQLWTWTLFIIIYAKFNC